MSIHTDWRSMTSQQCKHTKAREKLLVKLRRIHPKSPKIIAQELKKKSMNPKEQREQEKRQQERKTGQYNFRS